MGIGMIDFIICASANLFRIFLIDRFVSAFLGKDEERNNKNRRIFICACFYIINTALFWEFHTVWINMLCNLIGISAIVRQYTKSIKTNLFVTSSIYLINCGCDVTVSVLFMNYQDGGAYYQVCGVIVAFLIFICELAVEKMITIHNNTEAAQSFPLILIPVCSIAVIGLLIYSGSYAGKGIAIVSVGLLIVNFLMLYLYSLLLRSITQKYEMEMLRQKVRVYANQLDIIMQGEERIKALRHDMKHHLNELMLLANRHGVAEMQEYIERMETFIQNPNEIVTSGNMEIDSVLNYMLRKAEDELETVIVKVMLPEDIKHSFDINILIGNLLENAIEAAGQTDRKYLSVNITLKRGVLKIKIENSFIASNIIEDGQKGEGKILLTTKDLKERHGIGLKNVKKIAEKYNGTMKVTRQNDIFCVNMILYMSGIENGI